MRKERCGAPGESSRAPPAAASLTHTLGLVIGIGPGAAETAELSGFSTGPARFSPDRNAFLRVFSVSLLPLVEFPHFFIGAVVKSAPASRVEVHNG